MAMKAGGVVWYSGGISLRLKRMGFPPGHMSSRKTSKGGIKASIEDIEVACYTVPTDGPESDGTLEWNSTTLVLVEARAGGMSGIGFSYSSRSTGVLIEEKLKDVVLGADALDVAGNWQRMVQSIRNLGRPGVASMAISALDIALWDLKAKILELPLVRLLGQVHPQIPAYGSGGF